MHQQTNTNTQEDAPYRGYVMNELENGLILAL